MISVFSKISNNCLYYNKEPCVFPCQEGWHERNGGNLTYRMKEEVVAQCRPFFDPQPREWVNMGVQADNLAGEYFITTGSGKFQRARKFR